MGSSSSVSSPRVRPVLPASARAASSVPATYGVAEPPASWRIERRSSGSPKMTSVETTKPGSRSECTCVPATVAPRASRGPATASGGCAGAGARTAASRSASSRDVPLGTSAFDAEA